MRRGSPERRPIPPDMKYNSVQIQTMVQHVLKRGKKSTALLVIYGAMDLIRERAGKDPLEVFESALRNVSPAMEVRPRRVGGATYQVPMEVSTGRRTTLAIRWILGAARERSGRSFSDKLASEVDVTPVDPPPPGATWDDASRTLSWVAPAPAITG